MSKKWSLEKKIGVSAIFTLLCIVASGFITAGQTFGEIAELKRKVYNLDDMGERAARTETKIDFILERLDRIENFMLKGKE